MAAAEGRVKRRCVLRKAAVPSGAHYVGYVEDDETPEAIMRKFEAMERVLAATGRRGGPAGSDASEGARKGPQECGVPERQRQSEGESGQSVQPQLLDAGNCQDGGDPAAVPDAAPQPGLLAGRGPKPGASDQQQQQQQQQLPHTAGPSRGAGQGKEEARCPDEVQLAEIFRATSAFSVRAVLGGNAALLACGGRRGGRGGGGGSLVATTAVAEIGGAVHPCHEAGCSEDRLAWSDGETCTEDEEDLLDQLAACCSDGELASAVRRKRAKKPRGKDAKGVGAGGDDREYGATAAPVPCALASCSSAPVVRTPLPALPAVWGPVQPPPPPRQQQQQQHKRRGAMLGSGEAVVEAARATYHTAPDICAFDFARLQLRQFLGVLIGTGWEADPGQPASAAAAYSSVAPAVVGGTAAARRALTRRLAGLPMARLCPRGFVFVWTRKQLLSAVVSQLCSWGYAYAENLTWVWRTPCNRLMALPAAAPTAAAHATLLIFRREGVGRDIELRHQRNPDVVFDCVEPAPGREWRVPAGVYSTIETMLPTGLGAFLELWAAASPADARPGWTHVAEAP